MEDCLIRGLGQFANLRGRAWQEIGGGVFEEELISRCILCSGKCRVEPGIIKSNENDILN